MNTSLRLVRDYPHAPEKVWHALTDPALLAEWLMPNDFEPRVGHRFTFRTEPAPGFDGIVHCEVLELAPPRRMVFTWKGGPIDTVMTFQLERTAAGTRLLAEQTGFRGLRAWMVSRILRSGNARIYGERLPRLLDRIDAQPGGTEPAVGAAATHGPDEACLSGRERIWARMVALLGRKPAQE